MKSIIAMYLLSIASISATLAMELTPRQWELRKIAMTRLIFDEKVEAIEEFCKKGGAVIIDQELYDRTQSCAAREQGKPACERSESSPMAQIAQIIATHAPASVQKIPVTTQSLKELIITSNVEGVLHALMI